MEGFLQQRLKRDLYRARADAEPSLMARGIFESASRAAETALAGSEEHG